MGSESTGHMTWGSYDIIGTDLWMKTAQVCRGNRTLFAKKKRLAKNFPVVSHVLEAYLFSVKGCSHVEPDGEYPFH